MKFKSKRNFLTVILAVLFAAMLALGVSFMLPKNEIKSAKAVSGATVTVKPLLYSDYATSDSKFDMDGMNDLYVKLTGNQSAKYKDVKELGTVDSSYFRGKNGGSDLLIDFGGMKWTAVYLTKDNDGDVILTLWLAENSGTSAYHLYNGGSNNNYPGSMYSSSYIRAIALNGGNSLNAGYSKDGNTLESISQDSANAFAKFTMEGVTGSLTDYIVTPAQAGYQANENSSNYMPSNYYTTTNDAYDEPEGETHFAAGLNYSQKPNYSDWKYDYIWLPSASEVGYNGSGIWKPSASQCSCSYGSSWLRSNGGDVETTIMYVAGATTTSAFAYATGESGVRPALHFNVSKAAGVAVPKAGKVDGKEKTEDTYTGSALEFPIDYDSESIDITSVTGVKPDETTAITNISTSDIVDDVFKPTVSGTYTVTFNLKQSTIDEGLKWGDRKGGTDKRTLTFKVNPKPISVPTILNATQTYKGGEYEFGLSGYDKDLMSVPSGGYTSNNGSVISWDVAAEKFKATDAAEYSVKFHMDSLNHIWSVGGSETSADQSKTITINKKELTINTTPASGTNPSWDFGSTGSITYTATAAGITDAEFELNVYYIKDGETSNPLTLGIDTDGNTLDVSKIASSGNYKLCIELTSASANKNYSIADNKFEMPFEIKSGGIDFSVINWTYRAGDGNATALFNNGTQETIRYNQDSSGNAIKYYVSATIAAGGYLSVDTSYNSNGYKNGFWTTKDGGTYNDGCTAVGVYKTRIALKTDADHLFKTGGSYGSFGGDDTKGWYEIEWEISKGKVDGDYLDNLEDNLQYRTAGGSWQKYDPENPPQFGSGAIEIRVDPTKYPAGVTGAEVTVNDKNTAIGSYTAQVKFTYDSNYENEGNKSFTWQIGAMVIDVDWTSEEWKDASGENVLDENDVPYQIRVLNIKDDLKQYIDYKYYLADPNNPSVRGTYIGMNDSGLEDLINAPYNASSTNAVYIYVEAVIKSGVTQYQLKDNTGNDYPNSMLYRLGATNTLVKVTLETSEMEYGGDKLTSGILKMFDTGTNGTLDESTYVDGIYIYDSANTNLGLLKDFDGTKASVGTYTIEIKLNAAGNETYTLTPGTKYTFTIKTKAIPVPTVNEITFNNEFINLTDYLGGSWTEYKDIIKVGGTFDGVKNANTAYTATLTLTDGNYCWDYGTAVSAAGYSTAEGYTVSGDDAVATYDWQINPYVLDASNWNLKGKDGAVYNIPANLINGLDVNIKYLYHTDKAGSALEDGAKLSAGSTYFVKAELVGADAGNFVFKDTGNSVSDFAQYKIPQSGAAAFFGNVKEFMTKSWLGLPVWSWFLIALALLIL
ncbi:MAG: hypothetical protein K2I30_00050, partial [Clostridia bacterium]|nr:hypothetical protein [Clostridia bacterium]